MIEDRNAKLCAFLHRLLHQSRVRDGLSVLTDRTDACLAQRGKIHVLLAFLSECNRSDRQYPRKPGFLRLRQFIGDNVRTVRNRLRIRHRAYCRISARRGCRAACGNRFFICKARIAEMHMQIDQAGHDPFALSVQDLRPFRQRLRILFCHCGDFAVRYQNVPFSEDSVFRIDYCPLSNQQRTHRHLRLCLFGKIITHRSFPVEIVFFLQICYNTVNSEREVNS